MSNVSQAQAAAQAARDRVVALRRARVALDTRHRAREGKHPNNAGLVARHSKEREAANRAVADAETQAEKLERELGNLRLGPAASSPTAGAESNPMANEKRRLADDAITAANLAVEDEERAETEAVDADAEARAAEEEVTRIPARSSAYVTASTTAADKRRRADELVTAAATVRAAADKAVAAADEAEGAAIGAGAQPTAIARKRRGPGRFQP